MKEELRKLVEKNLDAAVDQVFVEAHKFAQTKSGDISPTQELHLATLKEAIVNLIVKQTLQNLPNEKDN